MNSPTDSNPNRAPWTNQDAFAGPNAPNRDPAGPYSSNEPSQPGRPHKNSGLGCWFWGCLGSLVFVVLAVIGIGFGGYWLLTNQVVKYTDTQPAEIPIVEYDDEQLQELQSRIESFTNQVKPPATDGEMIDGETADDSIDPTNDSIEEVDLSATTPDAQPPSPPITELVLKAEEINALIAAQEELRGRMFIRIEDGRVLGQVSIPTDVVPGGKGRYFNADGEFNVSMEDGILVVNLTDASVKGQRIPDSVLEGIASENLAKDAYKDRENAEILRKFESIEVVDDSIVLKLRPSTEE